MIDALAPIALCVMGVIAWSIPRGWREDNEKLNCSGTDQPEQGERLGAVTLVPTHGQALPHQIPDGSRPREGSGAVSLSGPGAAYDQNQHGSDIS